MNRALPARDERGRFLPKAKPAPVPVAVSADTADALRDLRTFAVTVRAPLPVQLQREVIAPIEHPAPVPLRREVILPSVEAKPVTGRSYAGCEPAIELRAERRGAMWNSLASIALVAAVIAGAMWQTGAWRALVGSH